MIRTLSFMIGMLFYGTTLFDGLHYDKSATYINQHPEVIYTLTVDLSKGHLRVENGFSFGVLYGFESVSDMAERENPKAVVNGMFYQDFGLPQGIIVHDKIPVRTYDIGTPTVVLGEKGEVAIEEIHLTGKVIGEDKIIELIGVNGPVPNNYWGLFTSIYGSTTRVRRTSINYIISNGKVEKIIKTDSPVSVKSSEYVLTYVGEEIIFKEGERVDIDFDYGWDGFEVKEAFQTGGWLVKDGNNIAENMEPFMGYTTALQPRTMVGIKESGELIFVVVDGRNPGISEGLSGKEAAELMIEKDCVMAAYLDGGASSTMWIDGEIVNKPSAGIERKIAHSIMIFLDKDIHKKEGVR